MKDVVFEVLRYHDKDVTDDDQNKELSSWLHDFEGDFDREASSLIGRLRDKLSESKNEDVKYNYKDEIIKKVLEELAKSFS